MQAIILGSTGLTGSELLKQLVVDKRFTKIVVLTRRPISIESEKTEIQIIDFDKPEEWKHLIVGDVLFSAMGTTLKKAGSKTAQYIVDYNYQVAVAKAAAENGVRSVVLISSYGADKKAGNFYLRMKGEIEDSILKLDFKHFCILRPGQIEGERLQKRPSEAFALKVMRTLNRLGILTKFRPIKANMLAKAMINGAFLNQMQTNFVELDKVLELSEK